MATQSHACCTVPAVVDHDYKEKGEFVTISGMKTYTTGPSDATKAILVIFDIFGFFPQTLQGADILATGDSEQKYRVYVPDFFDGKPADISWYPPKDKDAETKLGEFFGSQAAPPKTIERVPKVLEEIKSKKPNIKEWAIVGFCWGGKVTTLLASNDSPFKTAAIAHPAMVDPNDAKNITIPIAAFPSGDEPKEEFAQWEKNLKVKHTIEWFPDQIHGFMAARSQLKDAKAKAAYEKGYKLLLEWLHETF